MRIGVWVLFEHRPLQDFCSSPCHGSNIGSVKIHCRINFTCSKKRIVDLSLLWSHELEDVKSWWRRDERQRWSHRAYQKFVNTKFLNCRKSNKLKKVSQIYFCINQVVSAISVLTLLQKVLLWFYLLWTWLKQEILLALVRRWTERSSQQISGFELVRDFLFFKFFKSFECSSSPSDVLQVLRRFLDFRLKFFDALEAEFLQSFGFLETLSSKWKGKSSIYSGFRG